MSEDKRIKAFNSNVITLRKPDQQPGNWLSVTQQRGIGAMSERDRVGKQAASVLFGPSSVSSEQYGRYGRILTSEQLWLCYQRVPDVRASIDAIVRRVATWDWNVAPTINPKDKEYQSLIDKCQEVTQFLKAPNTDGETWQEVWTKAITDLMVFDAGVLENVFGGGWDSQGVFQPDDSLKEIVALRGSTIFPIVDAFGHVEGYKQAYTGIDASEIFYTEPPAPSGEVKKGLFGAEQVVYMRLFANTQSPLGTPLIESIVNEVITMLRSSEHTMLAMDANEIPPGILVLTGIAGQAAKAAMADLQNMRGKDHRIRVITTPDPKGSGAHWVELRHTAKDVDFVNVISNVRQTIWRVFGVMPVEMGMTSDMPRSVGQVQLDVSSSHLINPILELIEAKINARILPLVANDNEIINKIKFTFDREAKLSPSEQKEKASSLNTLIGQGVITRNEARAELGMGPVESGDIMTITTGQGTFPLNQIVSMSNQQPQEPPSTLSPGTASDAPEAPPEIVEQELQSNTLRLINEQEKEVSSQSSEHRHQDCGHHECGHVHGSVSKDESKGASERAKDLMGNSDLPSDWQNPGRFSGYRTLDLIALHNVVVEYERAVAPLYEKMNKNILAEVGALYKPKSLTDDKANNLLNNINSHINRLQSEWSLVTERFYERAGEVGVAAARDFTGQPVREDQLKFSMLFADTAMSYLATEGGLLNDLRVSLTMLVSAMTIQSNATPESRAIYDVDEDIDDAIGVEKAVASTAHVVQAQKFRIKNWSGKLVELCNDAMLSGLIEASTAVNTDPDGPRIVPVEWYAEWVSVGDARMCPTCTYEGSLGFRPINTFTVNPGGATECGAKCRCVIVLWTKTEVTSGEAVPLSNTIN